MRAYLPAEKVKVRPTPVSGKTNPLNGSWATITPRPCAIPHHAKGCHEVSGRLQLQRHLETNAATVARPVLKRAVPSSATATAAIGS